MNFQLKKDDFRRLITNFSSDVKGKIHCCCSNSLASKAFGGGAVWLASLRLGTCHMYNEKNVAISGIHTHAGPGGYLQYFNWYATHGTSMSRTNSLITGDNKGATAHFMEDWAEQKGYPKGGDSIYPGIAAAIRDNRVHRRVPIIIPQPHENFGELRQLASSFLASGGRRLASSANVSQRVRAKKDGKPNFVYQIVEM